LEYIRDPRKTTVKKIKWQELKYTSLDDDLYRRTIDNVLQKCLGKEQAKVVVWETHDGICVADQSVHKMNRLLRGGGRILLADYDG
jgi:ABC-type iron transport system FetAB ATPase subunit